MRPGRDVSPALDEGDADRALLIGPEDAGAAEQVAAPGGTVRMGETIPFAAGDERDPGLCRGDPGRVARGPASVMRHLHHLGRFDRSENRPLGAALDVPRETGDASSEAHEGDERAVVLTGVPRRSTRRPAVLAEDSDPYSRARHDARVGA